MRYITNTYLILRNNVILFIFEEKNDIKVAADLIDRG